MKKFQDYCKSVLFESKDLIDDQLRLLGLDASLKEMSKNEVIDVLREMISRMEDDDFVWPIPSKGTSSSQSKSSGISNTANTAAGIIKADRT